MPTEKCGRLKDGWSGNGLRRRNPGRPSDRADLTIGGSNQFLASERNSYGKTQLARKGAKPREQLSTVTKMSQ